MDARAFSEDALVFHVVNDLKNDWKGKQVSDIIDAAGNQYVDLVMEGGGVLGIALLGYTYALEQVGIRFLSIAGTSAGSITALLLAAVDDKQHAKSERLLQDLANKNFKDFVDGDSDARDFIEAVLSKAGRFRLGLKALQVLDNLDNDLGLNPGRRFHEWIIEILERNGITTTAQLDARMGSLPDGLRTRTGEPLARESMSARLALIAAEISTQTKVEFPRMAGLFYANPNEVNPADYVRASMSVPYFFHPFRIDGIPNDGPATLRLWNEVAGYKEQIPKSCIFVDGGIVSNFPIDVFHQPLRIPRAPTFGVKLGIEDRCAQIDGPAGLLSAAFNSARHCLDYDFITRNPDYQQLVAHIDTNGHNWLNFSLTDEDKLDLFRRGVRTADYFLRSFNWDEYKETRRSLAEAYATASEQKAKVKQSTAEPNVVPLPPDSIRVDPVVPPPHL